VLSIFMTLVAGVTVISLVINLSLFVTRIQIGVGPNLCICCTDSDPAE